MAIGREYLSQTFLRPLTVYIAPEIATPLATPLRYSQAVVAEAIAPFVHSSPGRQEFERSYAAPDHHPLSIARRAGRRVGVGFADRRANQLLLGMTPSFRDEYFTTLEVIDHHGKSHVKRVKAAILLLDEHTPEVHVPQWVKDAQLRFAPEHDANQAYQEYRILEGHLPSRIDSKYGHGVGGAVMSLAMYKDYARSLHISEQEAKKISFATALMEIAHDAPSRIRQAMGLMQGNEQKSAKEFREEGGFEALRSAFENATVDLFSLSPMDMVDLLQDIKTRKGFDTPYGLGPIFEDAYSDVLAELAQDATPLLADISAKDKKAIQYATLIATIADMMDMILPNDEAFARMFTVPRAIQYPLSWNIPRNREDFLPKTKDTLAPFAAFFAKYGEEYWQEAQKLSIEELTVLQRTLSGGAVTNGERKLLEAFDIGTIIQGTELAQNKTIAKMAEHYQAMTLIDIGHQVAFFMDGDREAITSHLHTIFARQLAAIEEKLGPDHPDIAKWRDKLFEEADYVLECLCAKETGLHVYDPEEIASFQKVAHMVERAFWTQQYQHLPKRRGHAENVTAFVERKMHEYEERYQAGERPVTPTHNYHSTGDVHNSRTIYPPHAA